MFSKLAEIVHNKTINVMMPLLRKLMRNTVSGNIFYPTIGALMSTLENNQISIYRFPGDVKELNMHK